MDRGYTNYLLNCVYDIINKCTLYITAVGKLNLLSSFCVGLYVLGGLRVVISQGSLVDVEY